MSICDALFSFSISLQWRNVLVSAFSWSVIRHYTSSDFDRIKEQQIFSLESMILFVLKTCLPKTFPLGF
jgi:hypothetical protein